MAPTRPLARAMRESGGVMPNPGTSRQHMPPRNVRRGAEFSSHKDLIGQRNATRSELSALTVVNTRKNGSKLPSGPDEESRRIAGPAFDEATVAVETGDTGEAIWGIRAFRTLLELLNKKDLWDVIDSLSVGALDEKKKKSPEIRAACLDLMVLVHRKIMKASLNEKGVSGKVLNGTAEVDGRVQAALPLLDARAVSEAIDNNVIDHSMGLDTDFLEAEDRMAVAIVSLMESSDPWILGAAERASCEIDSPILIQALSGSIGMKDPVGDVVDAIENVVDNGELSIALLSLENMVGALTAKELWRVMDALVTVAESREKEGEVRAGAFEMMITVYDAITRFGTNGRDGGEIEKKMTIAVIKAALGTDMEENVSDAAMWAIERIDSPVLSSAFLSGQIRGEKQGAVEGIDTILSDKVLDVELAKFVNEMNNVS